MIRSYFFPRSMLRKSSIITLTPRSCRCCASSGLISTASIEKSPYFCSVLIMLPLPAPGSNTSIPPPQRENVEKCLDRRDRCRVEVVRLSGASSVCCTHCLPPFIVPFCRRVLKENQSYTRGLLKFLRSPALLVFFWTVRILKLSPR